MFDIIGDIHGQADRLRALLSQLGYTLRANGWQHPRYKAIFVGDFIDRGAKQLETLDMIATMVEHGNALAVMGNHEFNAIGWATPNTRQPGAFLRPHHNRNRLQHRHFLRATGEDTAEHRFWIAWFKQLPLFLDFGTLRIIHACWDTQTVGALTRYLDSQQRLPEALLAEAFNPLHPLFDLCEIALKGKELHLPDGISYADKEGTIRRKSRIKWWSSDAENLASLCLLPEPETSLAAYAVEFDYAPYREPVPVLFGHYWLQGVPQILSPYTACVDYSAALPEGKLVAYRWQGERVLTNSGFRY